MPVVNEILALLTVVVLVIVIRGLVSWAFERDRSATMHFALGITTLCGSLVLRSLYWDVLPTLVHEPSWDIWGEATGWTKINVVWNLMVLFASYHLLRAMQLLIPERERSDWPLWRAPFYPHGHLVERFIRWWRAK
jgi:hypothetical protein